MSLDTFVGLPLNQSIASAAWDSGDISWAAKTFLAGDGSGWVKSTQTNAFQGMANYSALDGQFGVGVFFKPLAGRSTTVPLFGIYLDANGTLDEYAPSAAMRAVVGEYPVLKLHDMAGGGTDPEEACALVDGNEYFFKFYRTNNPTGREYKAEIYDVTGGVVASTPKASVTHSVLTALPSTNKRVHFMAAGSNHPYVLIRRVESVDTNAPAADTTAPTLTSPSANPSSTSVTGSVTTNEANGTLYYLVNTTANPTAATVKGGSTQAVTASGSKSVSASGLTAATSYYLHFLHRDAAGNDSTVSSVAFTTTSGTADTTPPTLSAPAAQATGSSTASGTVATNEGGGTLYYLASANSTETAANVKAGSSQVVSATGQQTVYVAGLPASSTRYMHYLHRDAAGNDSAVASSASFTTPAADSVVPTFAVGAAITPGAVTSTSIAGSYPAASDNVAVARYWKSKDGGATWEDNGSGLGFTFTGLSASTVYQVRVRAQDAAGNYSTALQLSMTTSAAPAGGSGTLTIPIANGLALPQANLSGLTVAVMAEATLSPVKVFTAKTTDANGNCVVSDALLTAGTTYTAAVRSSAGVLGIDKFQAT